MWKEELTEHYIVDAQQMLDLLQGKQGAKTLQNDYVWSGAKLTNTKSWKRNKSLEVNTWNDYHKQRNRKICEEFLQISKKNSQPLRKKWTRNRMDNQIRDYYSRLCIDI